MRRIIYSKYSNERAEQFNIRTDMVKDENGQKYVHKRPCGETAAGHVENIYKWYVRLKKVYLDTRMSVNNCEKIDNGLEFEYLEGKTFEEELDRLLEEGQKEQALDLIKEYLGLIKEKNSILPFETTKEFEEVFGVAEFPEQLISGTTNNIDMIFDNMIFGKDGWQMIDYEWTFDFPIPLNYIIYRSLFYYFEHLNTVNQRAVIKAEDMYAYYGLMSEEIEVYKKMEIHFQKYVMGSHIPVRDMYEKIGKPAIPFTQVMEREKLQIEKNQIQVYTDFGDGFKEEESTHLLLGAEASGKIRFTIPVTEGVKAFRIDPGSRPCVVKFGVLLENSYASIPAICETNGLELSPITFVFNNTDPQILVNKIPQGVFRIHVELLIEILPVEVIWELCKGKNELDRILEDRDLVIEARDNTIKELMNSKSWKITGPLRMLGKNSLKVFYTKSMNRLRRYRNIKGIFRKVKQKTREKKLSLRYGTASFPTEEEMGIQKETVFPRDIKFSILVPLYNTPEKFLREMIDSVLYQTYGNLELCLADGSDKEHEQVGIICQEYMERDSRIKYRKIEKNLGISGNTNVCFEMATGDFIALFDHDDILHPSVLFENMKVICEKDADYVYTDETTFEGDSINNILTMHFKPDFSVDNLRANNYICHFSVFDADLLKKTGLFRSEYDGSQDHDMILRLTSSAKNVQHIPKILYYWRSHKNSVASDINSKVYAIDAAKRAVRDNLRDLGMNVQVESTKAFPTIFKIRYEIKEYPLISIVIPNKDHVEDLTRCINSIINNTSYANYEIIIVENNSETPEILEYYEVLKQIPGIKIVTYEGDFNYSRINNFGVSFAKGEYILLLNNDVKVITRDWIEELLMYTQRPDVGAAGAKLYYEDNTVQHAGIVIGLGAHRAAGHTHYKMPQENLGYMGRLCYAQDVSAVTGACLLVKKSLYDQVGGLDESFSVAFNDVDFCLKLRKEGYLNIFTPFAELYHYESKSRGMEEGEKLKRFEREVALFREKWKAELEAGDPYYNPNFSLDHSDYSLRAE